MQEIQVRSLGQEDRAQEPTPLFLPGESHEQRSLLGYSPMGQKESDVTEAMDHVCVCIIFHSKWYCP